MNDRYLFRGKRLDNGEWIQGDLSRLSDGTYIFPNKTFFGNVNNHKVNPSTVGQCTGLQDRNGKLIFEGDVIKISSGSRGVVTWLEAACCFSVMQGRSEYYLRSTQEIIGNIHDTPS